jgi:hypothetical protein
LRTDIFRPRQDDTGQSRLLYQIEEKAFSVDENDDLPPFDPILFDTPAASVTDVREVLNCEDLLRITDYQTLDILDTYTVEAGVTECLKSNNAEAWRISWAESRDPNYSDESDALLELPPSKWVHLICEGPYTYTYTKTTTVNHTTSTHRDAGSSTLSTPVTKTIQIRREIHFDEGRNLFRYFGGTLFEIDEEGAAQVVNVNFDAYEIVVEFKVAKKSKGKRVLSALSTMGWSEVFRDRDTTKLGVLNRVTGTWSSGGYTIPCSIIDLTNTIF